MIARSRLGRLLTVVGILWASAAHAQVTGEPQAPLPDPSQFSRGLYAEGELGVVTFVGRASEVAGSGVAAGARLGYDFWTWLALQAHVLGSTHSSSVATSPIVDQMVQLYEMTAELKVTIRMRQFAATLTGAGGMAKVSNNLLEVRGIANPGERYSGAAGGGVGFEYHTLNRHLAAGLLVSYLHLLSLQSTGALGVTATLRYTF